MTRDRLSMRKFKEVLRLKYDHHLTNRKIAKSCAMSHVTVGKYLDLAKQAGIAWPLPDDIDDSQIEQRLYANVSRPPSTKPVMPSMSYLFQEMKKKACHLAAAVVRIQARQSGRVPVQLFLRTVSPVAQESGHQPAPGAPGR
jgi:DNA-binding transcriptional regulator LsrR (DeoR family)